MGESDDKRVSIDSSLAFEAEVLGNDLHAWLATPDGTRWNPAFESLEEWQEWWTERGASYRERSLRLFEEMAGAINAEDRERLIRSSELEE